MGDLIPERSLLRAPRTTEDRLLGGRVTLRQPSEGSLRATGDPVLLAAAIPASPGQRVLEAGCGSGAGFLCLAARVPGLRVVAVEQDPYLAALAGENAAANGLGPDRVAIKVGDVRDHALGRALGPCAHAFANPPWWPDGTRPPAAMRRAATHGAGSEIADWAAFLSAGLAAGGTLTLILPTARLDAGMAAVSASGCGATRLIPLWPRLGAPAKRVLIQARRSRGGPTRLEAGLVLHGTGQAFSDAAQAILRDGAAL
jgi:tRNA1(Val) A37 N6-methylase TrmN6